MTNHSQYDLSERQENLWNLGPVTKIVAHIGICDVAGTEAMLMLSFRHYVVSLPQQNLQLYLNMDISDTGNKFYNRHS
jgi:hypothetical protein